MTTATTPHLVKKQRICRLCRKPEGDHSRLGEFCPDATWFSETYTFEPQEPIALEWQPGDNYTVEGSRQVTGVVIAVRDTYVLAWEVEIVAGEVRSFIKTSRFFQDLIRLVAE